MMVLWMCVTRDVGVASGWFSGIFKTLGKTAANVKCMDTCFLIVFDVKQFFVTFGNLLITFESNFAIFLGKFVQSYNVYCIRYNFKQFVGL